MSQITKRALEQSLKNLLLKKPLTKITINDIAEDCGINRMTFYYHFKDIYDLVEWSCLEDARKALEEKKTYETWQQGFIQLFEAVRENKPFIMNVYRCVHREQVEKYLKPLVDNLLLGVINEEAAGMTVRDEDKSFIAQVYSYVFVGLMLDWIRDDMREDPEARPFPNPPNRECPIRCSRACSRPAESGLRNRWSRSPEDPPPP